MSNCKKIKVEKDVCGIVFGKSDYKNSMDGLFTINGDELIIDFNKDGKVTQIEILGNKPCQHIKLKEKEIE